MNLWQSCFYYHDSVPKFETKKKWRNIISKTFAVSILFSMYIIPVLWREVGYTLKYSLSPRAQTILPQKGRRAILKELILRITVLLYIHVWYIYIYGHRPREPSWRKYICTCIMSVRIPIKGTPGMLTNLLFSPTIFFNTMADEGVINMRWLNLRWLNPKLLNPYNTAGKLAPY